MSINLGQLIDYIIKPALKQINLYSKSSEAMLVGTCAQESQLGAYLHQVGGGPALGIFQMEPATYKSLWSDFMINKEDLKKLILQSNGYSVVPAEDAMIYNFKYAAQMARLRYLWVNEGLPQAGDLDGQAKYWARYYNTINTAENINKFKASYKQYVGNYYLDIKDE